jgi:transposase
MELTDKQWEARLEPVISQSACKKDSRGRKPRDPREVLNGIYGCCARRAVEEFA